MSFAARITRSPIPFDPDRGAEVAAAYGGLAPELVELLSATGACSPFLHGLLLAETTWLRDALEATAERVLPDLVAPLAGLDAAPLKPALRLAKRRVALFTALADLGGVWTLEEATGALTDFADRAVQLAAEALTAAQVGRGKLPDGRREDCAGLVLLAMGKMGANELNYSSDIDLISLFDDSRHAAADLPRLRSVFVRVTRDMAALLSDLTGDGYVFRTDLRLRPDPSVTPVCLSMAAAEGYYESVGRTWERAAHIKARPCAGDVSAGAAYLTRLRPFIWRKHLDFAAIEDAHDMRLRIRAHRGLGQRITPEGHDLKLGAGGIREIEFFTQTRQIIAGGRDPELRQRGTVPALRALAGKGWVPAETAEALIGHYRAHRQIEHRIQMIADAQTHKVPATAEGLARVAALNGQSAAAFRDELTARLTAVAGITEDFFAPSAPGSAPEPAGLPDSAMDGWRNFPALRSHRASAIFKRLRPMILAKLGRAANPAEAVTEFGAFLSGLPAGVQIFSLFEANPQLVDLIVDIAATAPHLAAYLGRNAGVLDAVLGGEFFSDWPGADGLTRRLAETLSGVEGYEDRLDAARRWQKEWHFRVGVHHLRGLIDADGAGRQYADLAEAVLGALWPVVVGEFTTRHGHPPGRGAAVIGMGSLGSARLTAASDLDLIVIYDADGEAVSDGPRGLQARVYYARLTKALVTALSAPMAEGRLYEVDMRLRPSGRQGPVATSFASFTDYQRNEAWTWEHLALTRARPVAGTPDLCAAIEAFRRSVIARPRDAAAVVDDLREMRDRIASAKGPQGALEAKLGRGRMQDVELLAQAGALIAGSPERGIAGQLEAGRALGWFGEDDAGALARSWQLMWQLQSAARLLTGDVLSRDRIGQGGADLLLRETGSASFDDLEARVAARAEAAAEAIDRALQSPPGGQRDEEDRHGRDRD